MRLILFVLVFILLFSFVGCAPTQAPDLDVGVWTKTIAVKNAGRDTPGNWEVEYTERFTEIYNVFAVLQGFSLYNNENNTNFNRWEHHQSADLVPQHVFVRIIGFNEEKVWGQAYCSEASNVFEYDNSILFTVVVIGRK